MDRDWLEAQLAAGRSIESIAKEVGKHPSTVSYWLRKHGLTSHYAEVHGPRGSLARDQLAELVRQGLRSASSATRWAGATRPSGTGCARMT